MLRNIVVVRLALFSAWHGREPSRLVLSEWQDAERDVQLPNSSISSIQDSGEQVLIGHGSETLGTIDQVHVHIHHESIHHSVVLSIPDRDTDEVFCKTANCVSRYWCPFFTRGKGLTQ